ncbi:ABC transporter substrate-binding protein [Rhizobium sp. Root1204]|uniref:ABC transporter substrate-binding protein n=1 Tax=Rhizobium sp. Root1204 TaxID=1736428 RepID=UPI0007155071|nr:ABC transporter substrate-binding protein [Rhizobium sp. Root1204]KQV36357.1 hemin ABC transporter substrate-binding protein [Rhizobium sp. Root1204]
MLQFGISPCAYRKSVPLKLARLILALVLLFPVTVASAQEVLRVPLSADISTLDPDNGFEVAGLAALDSIYEGLVEYEPGSTAIVGQLADRWEVSNDGLTYTFKIRDGVKFHDGNALNAAAVVTSLDRRRTGKLVQNYTLANVESLDAVSGSLVRIKLYKPQPSFLDSLASPWGPKILSPEALKEHDSDDAATGWLTNHAVGTGPFKLEEFKRGDLYTLRRNDDYWGKRAFFSVIELPVVPDLAQQILMLKAGKIDAVPTNYPFAQLNSLPDSLEVSTAPSMTQFDAFLKPGSLLDDASFRSAVLTVINPSLWAKDAFGDHASVSTSIYPKALFVPQHPIVFPTDIHVAKASVGKTPTSLTIGLFSANPSYGRIADLLIAQLATIGIQATSSIMPPGAAYAMKGNDAAPDMLLIIASPDAANLESQAKAFFTKDAPLNLYGRIVPGADAIVDKASAVTNVAERNQLFERAGQIYFDQGVVIPLVDVDDVIVHARGLKDLGLRAVFPRGTIDFATVRR